MSIINRKNAITFWVNFIIKEKSAYLVIGIVACFYLINNLIWLRQNTYPSGPDEPFHLIVSLKFFQFFSSSFSIVNIKDFLLSFPLMSGNWPPFFHISSAILDIFLGTSYISSVMINIPYLIILLFSVYSIGLKLFDKNTGILSVVLISMYPMIFRYSRFFGPDFALTAMVCLSIYFLLYTEHFGNRKFSISFGISLGLGMLTKWTFLLFLIGPLTYILLQLFFTKAVPKNYFKRNLKNFAISMVIGILISLIWYLPTISTVLKRIRVFFWDTTHYPPIDDMGLTRRALFQLDKFFVYFYLLISDQISFFFFMIFLITVIFYFLRHKNRLILILWYIVPYFILSLQFHKEARFMLPSLPIFALISAAGFQSISTKKIKLIFLSATILLGLIQFFNTSYSRYTYEGKQSFTIPTAIGTMEMFYNPATEHHFWSYGPPFKENWEFDKIALCIEEYYKYISTPKQLSCTIGLICIDNYARKIFVYPHVIEYYFTMRNSIIKFSVINLLEHNNILNFINNLDKFNSIIFISKNNSWPCFGDLKSEFNLLLSEWIQGGKTTQFLKSLALYEIPVGDIDTFFIQESNRKLEDFLKNKDGRLKLINEIKLPDGYSAYIYAEENYLIKKNLLKLLFLNGRACLWYNNESLTPDGSIETHFRYKNKVYSSCDAIWDVQKVSDNKLEAMGRWEDLPFLTQILQFEFTDGMDVRCTGRLKMDKNVDIDNIGIDRIELSFRNKYNHWFTIYKEGKFKNIDNGGVILKDASTKLIGVFNNQEKKSVIPSIFFILEKPMSSLAQIHYSRGDRRLIYWTDLIKESLSSNGLDYILFKVLIKTAYTKNDHKKFIEEQKAKEGERKSIFENKYSLVKDNTRIFLDFGQGRIYWKGQEITEGFGFYTSILANDDFWRDSQNVLWNMYKIDESTLVARGQWVDLPLSQIWQIKLKKGKVIEWSVELEVHEKIMLKKIQTNIILRDVYKAVDSNTIEVQSQKEFLPRRIKFMSKEDSNMCCKKEVSKANFLNSDATLLTYYGILNNYIQPGRYENYFKGEIKLE